LSRARSQRYWGREALLCVNGQPLVFARAVRGPWRALRRLGTRPLADLLFGVRPAHRDVLSSLRLPPASPWHSRVGRALGNYPASPQPRLGVLWMRRALFA
jgi:chorismate--pyruvate lyase